MATGGGTSRGGAVMDPAFQMISEAESKALYIAVVYALREGLASEVDPETGDASNRAMVSVGRKLGCAIPPEYEDAA